MSGALLTADIRDGVALAGLQAEWWDLWRRSPTATPFQSPAWLLAWWRAFAPGELFTITVRRDGALVGLAPFYIEQGERGRRLLPLGIAISDYLDILVAPDAPDAADAIADHIAHTEVGWESWELIDLPPQAAALGMRAPPGSTEDAGACSACPVLDLSATREGRSALTRGKRRDLNLARNRVARRGAVSFLGGAAYSPLAAVETLFRLHAARWESRGEAGVLADQRVQDQHRMAAPALADAGLLRVYVMTIGGTVAAAYYGFLHRRRAYAYLMGFDPAFAYESPGALLLAHAIQQAAGEGAREFDMLRGQEPYKYTWGAQDRWTRRRVFARTPAYARAV